jgi:hypothetical protein
VPPTPQPQLKPVNKNNISNPFGIDLVAATETVKLPSEGRFYEEGSTLHGVGEVEIRHMTAREEDILANPKFIEDGTIFDKLLRSILVDKTIDPSHFLPTDRTALMYAARITGYGPEYVLNMPCEACGQSANFSFDISKYEVVDQIPDDVEMKEDTSTFVFTLPKTQLQVEIRLLTTEDQDFIGKQNEKAEKIGISVNKTANLFRRSVVSVNGVTDQASLNQLFENLPAIDARKIRTVINNIAPRLSTKQPVACGSCGTESEREVPFTLGFFWPDV